jgi:hypothetical protein
MSTSSQPYTVYSEGQIALEQAMFCLECELIFAGIRQCPRCADKAVWPLAQWLPTSRPSAPPKPTNLVVVAEPPDTVHARMAGIRGASTKD